MSHHWGASQRAPERDDPRFEEWIDRHLWSRADRTSGCWVFLGGTTQFGYGSLTIRGKRQNAHRWALELTTGPLPDGMDACHTCDNPPCVNPQHLFAGTRQENLLDASRKRRNVMQQRPEVLAGERNGYHKLTEEQVRWIRRTSTGRRGEVKALAATVGISPSAVSHILTGRRWKSVR